MPESLPDLIRARLAELDLSYRRAAAKSHGKVSHGTLHNIATGKHLSHHDDETLEGIALALSLPKNRVRAAAGVAPDIGPLRLPKKANRLSPEGREQLLQHLDYLLRIEGR